MENIWPLYNSDFKTKDDVVKITIENIDDYFKRGLDPNWQLDSQIPIFMCVNNIELYNIMKKHNAMCIDHLKYQNDRFYIESKNYGILKLGEISDFLIDEYKDFLITNTVDCFENTKSLEMLKFLDANHYNFTYDSSSRFYTIVPIWKSLVELGHEELKNFLLHDKKIDFNFEFSRFYSTNYQVKLGYAYVLSIFHPDRSSNYDLKNIEEKKIILNDFLKRTANVFALDSLTKDGNNIYIILHIFFKYQPDFAFEIVKIFMELGVNPFQKNNVCNSFYDFLLEHKKKYKVYIKFLEESKYYKDINSVNRINIKPLLVDSINDEIESTEFQTNDNKNSKKIKNEILKTINEFEFVGKKEKLEFLKLNLDDSSDLNSLVSFTIDYLNKTIEIGIVNEIKNKIYDILNNNQNNLMDLNRLIKHISQTLSNELYSIPNLISSFSLFNYQEYVDLINKLDFHIPYRMVKTRNIHLLSEESTDIRIYSDIRIIQLEDINMHFFKEVKDQELVYLFRDINNQYDKNAIVVVNFSGYIIGFLPSRDGRKIATTIVEQLDNKIYVYGKIIDKEHLIIDIYSDIRRLTTFTSEAIRIDRDTNIHIDALIKSLSILNYKNNKDNLSNEIEEKFLNYLEDLYSNNIEINSLIINVIQSIRNQINRNSKYEL